MTTTQAPEDGASPLAARDGAAQDEQRPGPVRRRWCLGTRLVVAATAVWAVVLTLHVLLVDRWWPWLIFEVAPPLILVVVPLLLLVVTPLARPVRRRLSVVLVVLLLAGAYLAGFGRGWAATPTAGGPAGTTIKVFAWNTNYWDMSDDKGAFYAFLRRQDADVYLLQEYLYWDGDRPVRIDDTARLRAEFPGYRILVQGELLTLTRLPVVAADHAVPETGADWYWKGGKAQRTDIRVGGRTVSFYNVHLPVPFRIGDDPLSGRFYRELAERWAWRNGELSKLRADLAANPNPVVVAGDFNSAWMEVAPLGGGTRLHTPAGSVLPVASWPVSEYPFPRVWRLDWLFTSPGLTVSGYRFTGGAPYSDHQAQEFRIAVADEAPAAHSATPHTTEGTHRAQAPTNSR